MVSFPPRSQPLAGVAPQFTNLRALQDTIQQTARVVTSKPVQRAVVNTVLVVSSAVSLLCVAAIASALFFQNFVPDQVLTTPVHLQYG